MKEYNSEKHEFAIYSDIVEQLASLKALDIFEIANKELYHRIIKVVRLRIGYIFTLFNDSFNIPCTLVAISKDKFTIRLEQISTNKKLTPQIYWLLPSLKKEAFEDCLYTLTEMGIQEIYPVTTRKSQQIAHYIESSRVKNILATAAEQAKQFILPHIHAMQPLEKALNSVGLKTVTKLFFDPTGLSFFDVIQNLKQKKIDTIVCAIGPEGDLTEAEKKLLHEHNFQFCKLTDTVLRAKEAVTVATGILRSLL